MPHTHWTRRRRICPCAQQSSLCRSVGQRRKHRRKTCPIAGRESRRRSGGVLFSSEVKEFYYENSIFLIFHPQTCRTWKPPAVRRWCLQLWSQRFLPWKRYFLDFSYANLPVCCWSIFNICTFTAAFCVILCVLLDVGMEVAQLRMLCPLFVFLFWHTKTLNRTISGLCSIPCLSPRVGGGGTRGGRWAKRPAPRPAYQTSERNGATVRGCRSIAEELWSDLGQGEPSSVIDALVKLRLPINGARI